MRALSTMVRYLATTALEPSEARLGSTSSPLCIAAFFGIFLPLRQVYAENTVAPKPLLNITRRGDLPPPAAL
jgi:hypothetical protein